MYQLTPKDYDNLFWFYSVINSDYSNYENVILFSLATIFDFRLTAFVEYKVDINGEMLVERTISNSVRKEMLDQYRKKYYVDDVTYKKYSQICYSKASNFYFTDDELEIGEFKNTDYAKFVGKFNITHEAVIGINESTGSLIRLIKVFKTEDAGEFTEREKELFQHIGKAFNQSKTLYSQYLSQQRKMESVSAYCDEIDHGFAILDGKGRLIKSNDAFMEFSSKLSTGLTKKEIANDIIFAVTGKNELPQENYFREEAHVNGLAITLQKKKVVFSSRTENLYFITLQKDKGERTPNLDTLDLTSRYGLTRREADVTMLLAKGYNNQEIAEELYIGVTTVKSHISSIYGKLAVKTRTELIRKLRAEDKLIKRK